MKLPNGNHAYIPPEKLRDYLLSPTHPVGRTKARFFQSLGFTSANTAALEQQLQRIAEAEDVSDTIPTPYGVKYVVFGSVLGDTGRSALLATVWIIEPDDDRPRLVTAYPAERRV